jgi:hypothetical protein
MRRRHSLRVVFLAVRRRASVLKDAERAYRAFAKARPFWP